MGGIGAKIVVLSYFGKTVYLRSLLKDIILRDIPLDVYLERHDDNHNQIIDFVYFKDD